MGKVHASLFSGLGAADLAATWMGWDNAFWCEIEDFPRTVLSYWFPKSKGYGNIKETDFTQWRGKIDILTGGFPCQPFSVAGQRKGADDDRYLWPEMLRAIREIRPTWVISENVAGILSMVQPGKEVTVESQTSLFEKIGKETLLEQEHFVETVCRSIEQEGYKVQPIVIPACSVEAPHLRYRVFFLAHCANTGVEGLQRQWENGIYKLESSANSNCPGGRQILRSIQSEKPNGNSFNGISYERNFAYSKDQRFQECYISSIREEKGFNNRLYYEKSRDWRNFPTKSPICRGNDGLPFDVDCLTVSLTSWCNGSIKGYGNAIVPQVIYEIFKAIELISK